MTDLNSDSSEIGNPEPSDRRVVSDHSDPGGNFFKRYWKSVFKRHNGIPSEVWMMVQRRLSEALNAEQQLTAAEENSATAAYQKDESSRDNRTGACLIGIAGTVGAGTGVGALASLANLNDFWSVVAVCTVFAFGAVGYGLKVLGIQREGVGLMVGAVLDERRKDLKNEKMPRVSVRDPVKENGH